MRPTKKELAGEALIYERANGVVFAKFRDPPKNQKYTRWEIGRDVTEAPILDYALWAHINDLAKDYPTLQKQVDKLLDVYYIIKDGDKK
jgi:hypothetical protein|tara:strand:- start:304 stop:570 length:267 start_codon:yes stop_codon:yes gene_type:complete